MGVIHKCRRFSPQGQAQRLATQGEALYPSHILGFEGRKRCGQSPNLQEPLVWDSNDDIRTSGASSQPLRAQLIERHGLDLDRLSCALSEESGLGPEPGGVLVLVVGPDCEGSGVGSGCRGSAVPEARDGA